ncbi:MAG: DUF2075 domain-containing protein [Pseudobutyrivibrio sp.]|nr:DUF2075 domain-containing protein [Pseudobutyrivibrio sp.]
MLEKIRTYSFNEDGLKDLEESSHGINWPVVYLIHDDKYIYIGETTSAAYRIGQHLKNEEKKQLDVVEIVFDNEYNKSVILDYEQRLIRYFYVDGRFKVLNKNKGQQSAHDYYDRNGYRSKFPELWKALRKKKLVEKSIEVIENDNIFKFSPYNTLTSEQNQTAITILKTIVDSFHLPGEEVHSLSLVNGCAGTGKTVLAISIINSLVNAINIDEAEIDDIHEYDEMDMDKLEALKRIKDFILFERNGKQLNIGFVFPMDGIRGTVRKVFKACGNGLTSDMIIGPNDVVKKKYDVLFVDEAHRLKRRKNLTGYKAYDDVCEKLGLDKNETNQLEWILKSARHVVLFYDKNQSVKSSDIIYKDFESTYTRCAKPIWYHVLQTQMRCEGGDSYIKYVKQIMDGTVSSFKKIENYDFLIFDDVNYMVETIRNKDLEIGLCKTVAGFAWDWKTKPKGSLPDNMDYYNDLMAKGDYDIEISDYKYIWNLANNDWINRKDSTYTIGCIHSSQGYDMNYCGVIFGEEIDYDSVEGKIVVKLENYKDKKVKAGTDEKDVKKLIINTYTTMLARGIKGCYVYACNPSLQEYLKKYIAHANDITIN